MSYVESLVELDTRRPDFKPYQQADDFDFLRFKYRVLLQSMDQDRLRIHCANTLASAQEGSQQAVMVTAPQLGVIGDELSAPKVTIVPIEQGHAIMPGNVRVPLNPMVGVIGVAPAGKAISCGTPDSHGGNMDCKMITAGSTLWLPVNVPGALFALGDLHAAMGDGEVSVCGLEVPGEVLVELTVVKNRQLPLPMLENNETIFTLASAVTLDDAAALAARNMAHFIADNTSLMLAEAINILSIAGDLQICQVVDPLKTCRYALPKSVAAQLSLSIEGKQA